MADSFSIKTLNEQPKSVQLIEYAKSLPDGQVVELKKVADEIGYTISPAITAARKAGVSFKARLPWQGTGGYKTMLGNPKTVKQWLAAQKKLQG